MARYDGPELALYLPAGEVRAPLRGAFAGVVDRMGQAVAWAGRAEMTTADVVSLWRPGSGDWGWEREAKSVRSLPAEGYDGWQPFVADIAANGVRESVLLGDDGRVGEGHHRVCAAIELGMERLPVAFVTGCCVPPGEREVRA